MHPAPMRNAVGNDHVADGLLNVILLDWSIMDQHRRDVLTEARRKDLVGNGECLFVLLERHGAGIRLALVERWLRHGAFPGLEVGWAPITIQLFGRNPGEVDNLWICPGPASEVNRVTNTVVERTGHRHAVHPVNGHRLATQHVVEEGNLARDVLGGDCQMMDSVVARHLVDPSDHRPSQEAGLGAGGCVYARAMPSMVIEPVSPVFGADVFNIDLSAPFDDSTFAAIHHAFLAYGVLFFRNQEAIPEATQVAFARRFGPLHTHPAAPTDHADAAIFVIHAHRDSSVANGNGWHTDVSCDEEPPMATMLQVHTLPDGGGGDTLFANMEAAYQGLPDELRDRLRGLTALHESEHVYRGRYADRGVDDRETAFPSAEHPVVRTHPETGRLSIYVNRSFTTRIVGMDLTESHELLRWLFRHVERPEFQIRHRWAKNDLALWDNRCLAHFAIWDYWPNERKGNRVTILGERPFLDPESAEPPASNLRLSGGSLASRPEI